MGMHISTPQNQLFTRLTMLVNMYLCLGAYVFNKVILPMILCSDCVLHEYFESRHATSKVPESPQDIFDGTLPFTHWNRHKKNTILQTTSLDHFFFQTVVWKLLYSFIYISLVTLVLATVVGRWPWETFNRHVIVHLKIPFIVSPTLRLPKHLSNTRTLSPHLYRGKEG